MITMQNNQGKRILMLIISILFILFIASCNNHETKITITGEVRTIHFEPLAEDIFFDGEKIGTSDEKGIFEILVKSKDTASACSKISLESTAIVYLDYHVQRVTIIKLEHGESIDDFYILSGKVVLHSDGESVASGVTLRIDDHDVKYIDTDRNFDIALVHKDSIISVFKEGYEFIDVKMKPYNNICFSDTVESTSDVDTLFINGEDKQMKHLTGITFRLNDIKE